MKLVFTDQYANLFLLINGLVIIFFFVAKKKNKQRAITFGNFKTLEKVAGKGFLKSSNYVLLTRLLALSALLIGLSNPVLVQEVPTAESDYVIAMDASTSMLADDLNPTRFGAAKQLSSDFVSRLAEETSVGVVSFSGEVRKNIDLTTDKEDVVETLRNLESGDVAGTAIGDALSTSTSMLLETNRSRSVVLITDGRNNVGSSLNESMKFVRRNNVSVYTIGIGSEQNRTDRFQFVEGVNATRAEFPNLNENRLRRIANSTGGRFMTVSNNTALESAFVRIERTRKREDITHIFIFVSLGFLLLEWILGTTKLSTIP